MFFVVVWDRHAVADDRSAYLLLPTINGYHVRVSLLFTASLERAHQGQLIVVALSRYDTQVAFAQSLAEAAERKSSWRADLKASRHAVNVADAWFDAALDREVSDRDAELFVEPSMLLVTDSVEEIDWERVGKQCREAAGDAFCAPEVAFRCGLAAGDLKRARAAGEQVLVDVEEARRTLLLASGQLRRFEETELNARRATLLAREKHAVATRLLTSALATESKARASANLAKAQALRALASTRVKRRLDVHAA